jgi:hypothetical protein
MTHTRRHGFVSHYTVAAITICSLTMLFTARARAAESGCSNWVGYGKRACLSIDDNGKVTASVEVERGGRGWYGYLELTGPDGSLVHTPVKSLGAPDSFSTNWEPSDGKVPLGQYCAIDWRYDAYWQTHYPFNQPYFVESQYCLNVE